MTVHLICNGPWCGPCMHAFISKIMIMLLKCYLPYGTNWYYGKYGHRSFLFALSLLFFFLFFLLADRGYLVKRGDKMKF